MNHWVKRGTLFSDTPIYSPSIIYPHLSHPLMAPLMAGPKAPSYGEEFCGVNDGCPSGIFFAAFFRDIVVEWLKLALRSN